MRASTHGYHELCDGHVNARDPNIACLLKVVKHTCLLSRSTHDVTKLKHATSNFAPGGSSTLSVVHTPTGAFAQLWLTSRAVAAVSLALSPALLMHLARPYSTCAATLRADWCRGAGDCCAGCFHAHRSHADHVLHPWSIIITTPPSASPA